MHPIFLEMNFLFVSHYKYSLTFKNMYPDKDIPAKTSNAARKWQSQQNGMLNCYPISSVKLLYEPARYLDVLKIRNFLLDTVCQVFKVALLIYR